MHTTNIPFSLLPIETTYDLASRCSEIIRQQHPGDELFAKSLVDLDAALEQARLAIGSSTKKDLTQELSDANHARDDIFIGFRKHLEADLYNIFSPAVKPAAERLLDIIRKHGTRLHTTAMALESSLLASLFDDLSAAPAVADLTTTGLTEWVKALENAQDEFLEIQKERDTILSDKHVPTKEAARLNLVEKLTVVLKGLDFHANNDPETYEKTGEMILEVTGTLVALQRSIKAGRVAVSGETAEASESDAPADSGDAAGPEGSGDAG